MSYLLIENISTNIFQGLKYLETIDLRHNKLLHLDEEVLYLPLLQQVFCADNEWKCSSDMAWVLNSTLATKIKDLDRLQCSNYDKKALVPIVQFLQMLELECPSQCSCIMDHVAWTYPVNVSLLPFYTVNCSYRGLTEFPTSLPENTTTLWIQGNEIENIEPLASNSKYSRLNDVYLDKNRISSIDILEGSNWLLTFRVLSLRENYITQIPIYALDDGFAKNYQVARVFLGHNPWHCECTFVLKLQELMKKHHNLFVDQDDIRCSSLDENDNSLMVISNLRSKDVCKEPIVNLHRLTELDILNITLASLIVLIVGKLLYDYVIFKKTGKLPWIVMKMP